MATRPITCPTNDGAGFKFFRGNLVLDDGLSSSPPIYLGLKDLLIETKAFSKSKVFLKAGKSYLLSQTDISDTQGLVSFIAVKAIFPSSIIESDKYLKWEYLGKTYYMGEIMILSGLGLPPNPPSVNSLPFGWILGDLTQYGHQGGIIFTNPHTDFNINLEILVCKQ